MCSSDLLALSVVAVARLLARAVDVALELSERGPVQCSRLTLLPDKIKVIFWGSISGLRREDFNVFCYGLS